MKGWNLIKNVMLSLSITVLFANWSTKQLHECNLIVMWITLITVAFVTFMLLREVDKQFKELYKERRKKQNEIRETNSRRN